VFGSHARSETVQQAVANAKQIQAQRDSLRVVVPSPSARRSLAASINLLNSPGFQNQMRIVQRTAETLQERLGINGVAAAQDLVPGYLGTSSDFQAEFERAEEKIREGRADEILEEAAAVASKPEVLETVEGADKDTLIEAAERQANQGRLDFKGEARVGTNAETEIASTEVTEEAFAAVEYYALQLLRVLTVAVSVAVLAASSTVGLTQLGAAVAGLYALVEFLSAARERGRAT